MVACRSITADAPFATDCVDPSDGLDDSAEKRIELDEVVRFNTTVK
jgi:hypothetical protein